MKIYVAHSKLLDFQEELYDPLRKSILNTKHEIILPHEIHEDAKDFVSKDIIKTCDVMIAEVSFPGTGLGIEIGFANCFGCRIICIYRMGSNISGSLKVVCKEFIEYKDTDDLIEKIRKTLMP